MDGNKVPTPVMNQRILDYIDRDEVSKVAAASSQVTRTQLREDSFAMKIVVPQKATDDMLDRDIDERLRIIAELEADSPASKWVPFQTVPEGEYIYGPRYVIPFARIQTPRFQKDIDELRTYRHDIKKLLTRNSIKDGLAEYDGKCVATWLSIVQDTAGNQPGTQVATGKSQWEAFSGGLTKYNLTDAFKMLPRGNAQGKWRMRNHVMLMNELTAQDLKKLDVDEIGDENVSRMWREGLTSDSPLGLKAIFTLKDDLIQDNRVFFFPEEEFIGEAYYLTDWTMYMKKEAWFVEFYSYWLGGFGIGNIASICMADFDVS